MLKKILIAIVIVVVLAAFFSFFVVDETELAVVTRFGKVSRAPIKDPGLKFKIPFIETVNYFPKNIQIWHGDSGEIPTKDKTYIAIDSFALWRIVEPITFFQTISNLTHVRGRLDDIIDPAIRNFITSNSLIETVRKSNRELDTFEIGLEEAEKDTDTEYKIEIGREKITRRIREQAQPKLEKFGIELLDVKIKRINYVEKVRRSVYGRMIAERKQIAEKFRSEGKGEAQKIIGNKERDLREIESEAYRTAQELKGKADAKAANIYAEAFEQDPDFYAFVKTLEIYAEAFGQNTSLVLTTDSEFLQLLKAYTKIHYSSKELSE
jgi:membrane protease subunit HflC